MKTDGTFHTEKDLNEVGRDPRVNLSLKILHHVQDSLSNVITMLESGTTEGFEEVINALAIDKQRLDVDVAESTGQRLVEGVFDGCNMVGSDGNVYNIPPNYASKSRLVEGDMMKLTIRQDGSFLFKQVGPMERRRVVGTLHEDPESGEYVCVSPDCRWRLIRASVTYYRGVPGDEVVLLVPKGAPSTWGAVENIVKR